MKNQKWTLLLAFLIALVLAACNSLPFPGATPPPNTLQYDAPVTFTIKTGSVLPGTLIAYEGKSETGTAKVMIAGLLAPKQTADTVDWSGMLAPNVSVKLTTRVASYDDQSVMLVGTAHIEIVKIDVKPGGSPGSELIGFTVPVVTYQLAKNQSIPGTNVAYSGSTSDGAQFTGIEGYPYRKQFDSLQYVGRVAPKVFLRLDLRVLSYSDSGATVAGPAHIRIEN